MRGNKSADTRPEIALRSALHRSGHRFRKSYPAETEHGRVRVDIAFPRQRLAVFVDGCFWHRCPEHGNAPRANSDYWARKLERNVARDKRNNAELKAAGWSVLRIWEHTPPPDAVQLVTQALCANEEPELLDRQAAASVA
jgi:DNA mismatch endonuclease (patch repair protein)